LRARYDITTSQMLVTAFDFSNEDRRSNLQVRYS
jgi:glutamate 5-kinase